MVPVGRGQAGKRGIPNDEIKGAACSASTAQVSCRARTASWREGPAMGAASSPGMANAMGQEAGTAGAP